MIFGMGALNGRPTVFWDTDEYYSQGEYFAVPLHLVRPPTGARLADPTSVMPNAHLADHDAPLIRAGGRSAFYGLFLYVAQAVGTLWLLSYLQAMAASWVVMVTVRSLAPERGVLLFLGLVGILTLGSSLPFFSAFAMPDVFSALGILCVGLILLHLRDLTRVERIGIWILLVAILTFHRSNVATTLALLAISAGLGVALSRRIDLARYGTVLGAVFCALLATAAFETFFRADTGLALRKPPFLMARLLADGPGRDYLRAACLGGASLSLCRFKDKPLALAEDILWSRDPRVGVYSIADEATRAELTAEEPAFVLATLAAAPIAQIRASGTNWVRQLAMVDVDEPFVNPTTFLHNAYWSDATLELLRPGVQACEADISVCASRLAGPELKALRTLVLVIAILGLALDLLLVWRMKRRVPSDPARAILRNGLATAWLLVLGVVLNAAVCGILSGPFARYQARVIWLVPVAAILSRFVVGRHARLAR